ncbi:MAG: anthranilate synthase component I [Betaproteobacteria bacterium]|jgi:anthranilate synthase component 1|nr:anthranilate synthase component I [Rhodocyclaceae bacterium]MCA3134780.1 anthranilate synthase component I [Rhodocyclaceae bacterium]MCA3142262.1 anthranilate synthase component I [Rhodocyclaceae bacterium]MCA3146449.1 anthranilate synthase component I [Rhodocyclaceae bacterium]MCE2897255.1 anthranilate synthase component I [Betaproteobacteria bacterium]
MDPDRFQQYAQEGFNRVPLVLETLADLDTPLSVYLKLANRPFSYLLESVQGGERFGRYSFIGLPCETRFEVRGRVCSEWRGANLMWQGEQDDPLEWVRGLQARYRAAQVPGLPRFAGGLVGYFAYDTVRYIEKRLDDAAKPDALGTPDILLMLSDRLAVVDNLSGKLYLVVYADPREPEARERGLAQLDLLRAALHEPVRVPEETPSAPARPQSEFAEDAFLEAVDKAKGYIFEGDIMQVVLSQRLSHAYGASPLSLYRALRALNPSPYMFYFDLGGFHVVGASPEILVRLESGTVTLRPIAGTRPRGASREEDLALEQDLLADPKERAEHVMLMDLGRNDVGRVARTGTVRVTQNMAIERYSHVMHIVSNVEGQLAQGLDAIAVLRAAFPAGTLTGAPKVRAMEIIDELEPTRRGIYGGAVGYLGFNGDMDLAIAIRTAVIKDGRLFVQAGAGIVADSVPQSEWTETQNKARAILRAAELAMAGLSRRGD